MDLTSLPIAAIDQALLDAAPLADFIAQLTRGYQPPLHLTPLLELLERAAREPVECVLSVPPRHAKTETLLGWIAWVLRHDPTASVLYASHSQDFAESRCRRLLRLAEAAGLHVEGVRRQDEFSLREGGCVKAMGLGGGLAGWGFTHIVADDVVKSREVAESSTQRDRIWEAFVSDLLTRRDPRGTSVVVAGARWHPDDLCGRLEKDGWPVVNLPALDESTDPPRALWPAVWPAAALEKIRRRIGAYAWASLFMGEPRLRGGSVFASPTWVEPAAGRPSAWSSALPATGRVVFGCDLAYSAKTRADHSVLVRLVKSEGLVYVADVLRAQVALPEFAQRMKAARAPWAGAPCRWYTGGGGETGVTSLLASMGVTIEAKSATGDKHTRAQSCAAGWNRGAIVIPRGAPWAEWFLDEVCAFTGLSDKSDDCVDALAAGWDLLDSDTGEDFVAESRALEAAFASLEAPFAEDW